MKKNVASLLLFFALVSLACQVSGLGVTPTATKSEPTQTIVPLSTSTQKPTSTPFPTITPLPTPAAVGEVVIYRGLEITMLEFAQPGLIYPGGIWEYHVNDKSTTFLDIGVLVRNPQASKITIPWTQIGVQEENGNAWYPVFANSRTVEINRFVHVLGISIPEFQVVESEKIVFEKDTYLRMIFIVNKNPGGTILFNIEDSPYIAFELK